MRKLIFILLLSPLHAFSQDWVSFTDTAGMFTATYPSNWTQKIKTGNRVFFTSPVEKEGDDFRQNVNINVTTDPDYGTTYKIKDVVSSVLGTVKTSFLDFKEESTKFFKWNGQDACEIVYSGRAKSDDTLPVRVRQRICFYKTRMYLVTYVALQGEDAFFKTAIKIIDNLKFKS